MYTDRNFKTKKALKEAVAAYLDQEQKRKDGTLYYRHIEVQPVTIFAPGLGSPKENGTDFVEGPHYPAAHTWYAEVTMGGKEIVPPILLDI